MKTAEPAKSTVTSRHHEVSHEDGKPFFQGERISNVVNNSQPGFFFSKSDEGIQKKPFFSGTAIQTRLTVGQPGDKYELEADTMANKVVQRLAENKTGVDVNRKLDMRTRKPLIQRKPVFESEAAPELQAKPLNGHSLNLPTIQPKCDECDAPTPDLESRLHSSKGGGSSLPDDTRSQMEGEFGVDFSGVRVHTGSGAVQLNKELGAQAFTHGNDIYFGAGKFNTSSPEGKSLLAHELTHTVQQGASMKKKEIESHPPKETVESLSTTRDSVQTDLLDDALGGLGAAWDATGGRVVGAAADLIIDQIRPIAPNLVAVIEQIQKEGVFNFFKTKLLQGVNGIFDGLQNNSALIAGIFPQFGDLVARARIIVNALASGDCKPLFAAVNDLKELVTKMAGEAWDSIVTFFQPAVDFFTDIWESFALPAIEWLKAKAAHVWSWIQEIGGNIWNWLQPVMDLVGSAWDYIKGIIGLNADETGEEGLIQWAQRKAGEVWEEIKAQLQPIIEPARAMIAKIQAIIPLNAILNLRQTITDWLQKVVATSTAMGEDASNVGNVAAQTSLRDQILPAIQQSLENFRGKIAEAAAWVGGNISEIYVAVAQFFSTIRSMPILSLATGMINWVEIKVNEVYNWVQSKAIALFDAASEGLHKLGEFLRPVYDMLVRIVGILGDILGQLPEFLMGPLWMILPACIKNPIKEFFLTQILGRLPFFQKLQQIEGIWERLQAAAITILKQVFVDGNLRAAIWTFFSTMLNILGLPPQLVMRVIAKGAQSLSDILNDPLGFLGNFIRALKVGFGQFFNNIGTHLLGGLQAWLFSKMEGTGIEMPKDFSFKSMLKLAFQILGITVDMLLKILEEVTGRKGLKARIERVIGVISDAWTWFEKLINQGEEGGSIWDRLSSAIGSIWDMILDGVVGWLENTIIVKALAWVATKLDPTGVMAVITTVIDVFNVFTAIMEKAREILEMIERVLDGIGDLIKGIIAAAANVLERALAAAIPVAMAILSSLFGLDGVVDKVKEVIGKLRKKVEDGIRKVMKQIKSWVERLVAAGKEAISAIAKWLGFKKDFTGNNNEKHILLFQVKNGAPEFDVQSTPVKYSIFIKNVSFEANYVANKKVTNKYKADTPSGTAKNAGKIVDGELGKYEKTDEKDRKRWADNLVVHMNNIAEVITNYAEKGTTEEEVPSIVEWKSTNAMGMGQKVDAKQLTANYIEGQETGEEHDTGGLTKEWDIISQNKGNRSVYYYVRGHLLNAKVGGVVNNTNLTPLSSTANKEHLKNVERDAKKIVTGQKSKGDKDISKKSIINYTVESIYGNHKNRNFNNLNAREQLVKDTEETPGVVPTAIKYNLKKMKLEKGKVVEDKSFKEIKGSITNELPPVINLKK